MKILLYKDKSIIFKSPSEIKYKNIFQSKIYEFFYEKLPNQGDYKIYFDTDKISNKELGIDLISEFKKSDEGNKISKFSGGKGLSNEDLNRYRNQQIIREYLFNNFPEFVGIFQNNITFQKNCIENAKILLGINEIDINNFMDFKAYTNELYKKTWNRTLNESEKNSGVSTVGEISEKLVEGAFSGLIDNINFFNSKGNDAVKSYGDFVLMCLPNNLWLSVKSGYSRERLLASGYSNDILGVGFFEDFEEFTSESKNRNLKKVGFLAIYCPDIPVSRDQIENGTNTYNLIQNHFKMQNKDMPKNINGKDFIRKLSSIKDDLGRLLKEKDIKKRTTIGF